MTIQEQVVLSPAQEQAFQWLLGAIPFADVLVLRGRAGAGKTTIVERVHADAGGILLGMQEFMESLAAHQPYAIEEALLRMIEDALESHDLVIIDDLHLVTQIVNSCDYPRTYLLDAALTAILAEAAIGRKKLVFSLDGDPPWPILRRAQSREICEFTPDDYECICRELLSEAPGDPAGRLDYLRIHRFVPSLSAQQLLNACRWLGREANLDTETFLDHLRTQDLTSNVETEDVQKADWADLKGVDAVIRELEAKVALPFENDALSEELDLKPKRGVLLAGPPGTGKTTIGRALAHRLKGKFFVIDGSMVAGSGDFFKKVNAVFDAARKNAPSVVFIDDADVIFEDDGHHGFYGYLLTMLDGLKTAKADRVCVMMTAMHAGSLPPAILRSGRVELWLETSLPDVGARVTILQERINGLPGPIGAPDVHKLASASHGLTGADLKNVVEDGKLLFAHDRATGKTLRHANEYFLEAIETVRSHRRNYTKSRAPAFAGSVKFGFSP